MYKGIFIVSIFLLTLSIQASDSKKEVNNSIIQTNNELLQYRIMKVEENVQKKGIEFEDLTSNMDDLNIKVEKIYSDLKLQESTYNKILDTTKESYSFLSGILMSLIGLIGVLIVVIYNVSTSTIPKLLRKKVEALLEEMSKDSFSSTIEAWLIKELKNLNEQFINFESEYCKDKDLKVILKKELSKSNNENNNEIKNLLLQDKLDDAKTKLDDSDPTDISVQVLFAQYNLLTEDFDRALKYLKSAYSSEPENAYINHLMGLVYYAKNDENNTIDFIKKACLNKSTSEFDYLYLGKYFFNKKNVVQANFYLHQSSLFFPEELEQYIYLGKLYCETGNIGNAKEMLEKVKYLEENRRK